MVDYIIKSVISPLISHSIATKAPSSNNQQFLFFLLLLSSNKYNTAVGGVRLYCVKFMSLPFP